MSESKGKKRRAPSSFALASRKLDDDIRAMYKELRLLKHGGHRP